MGMTEDESESGCVPEFGCMSPESIRIKNNTKRWLHINDIKHVLVNVTLVRKLYGKGVRSVFLKQPPTDKSVKMCFLSNRMIDSDRDCAKVHTMIYHRQ